MIGVRHCLSLFILGLGGAAGAHPVHEVVQNAYVTLTPGAVDLQLELTAGPEVAGKIIRALDTNRDRRISPAEARGYARRVLSLSTLRVDGQPLMLRLIAVEVPPYTALIGAHGTIRINARAARIDHAGTASLAFRNGYNPAESRCDANIFIKPGRSLRYRVAAQGRSKDGRALTVSFLTVVL